MNKYTISIIALVIVTIMITGCSKKQYKPVGVDEATAKCTICNMQVKDDAFAVQLTTTKGKTYFFDDIGCLNEWRTKNPDEKIGAEYVRDYDDLTWIPYGEAYYAYDASFRSPMAYGIYSFKDRSSAQQFIDDQKVGKLLTADELATHNWAQNMDQMQGMEGMDGATHDEQAHGEMDMDSGKTGDNASDTMNMGGTGNGKDEAGK